MDIIHLLEVLKPAKDVITVQIANDKSDWWSPAIIFAQSVLPAIVTGFVAWKAMNNSSRQAEANSLRQSKEFRVNFEHQFKTLQLNARLETEVAMKKEYCKNVRESCAQYLSAVLHANRYSLEYRQSNEIIDSHGLKEEYITKRSQAHESFMLYMHKMTDAQMLLSSYLDPVKDKAFFDAIISVNDNLNKRREGNSDINMGDVCGVCISVCRSYIREIEKEIEKLPETVLSKLPTTA